MRDNFASDLPMIWRGLVRRPFYAIASIIMLALAIGANITAFGTYYGYDVRALPYFKPSRLYVVASAAMRMNKEYPEVSAKTYWAVRQGMSAAASSGLWAYVGPEVTTIAGQPRKVDVAKITPSFLTTLGVRPVIGRLPSVASGRAGGPDEAVISERFWRASFNRSDAVLGQQISVNGHQDRIVGVLPARFGFVGSTNLWVAYVPPKHGIPATNENNFMPIRLAKGASVTRLNVELTQSLHRIEAKEAPSDAAKQKQDGDRLVARPLRATLLGMTQFGVLPALMQFMALLLLVLAIANAGNLARVRNRSRLTEFAVRRILGARRSKLLAIVLLEQVPILVASWIGGSLIGWFGLTYLEGFQPFFSAAPFVIGSEAPAFIFGFLLSMLAVFLISVAPSMQIARQCLDNRNDSAVRTTLSPSARRNQKALGMVQVVFATILLIGSATTTISLHRILSQPRGFATKGRIVASLLMPPNLANLGVLTQIVGAVSNEPDIKAAGGSLEWSYPLTKRLIEVGVFPNKPHARVEGVYFVPIVGDYFNALGITNEAGHQFGIADKEDQCSRDLVISRDLARASFADGAIGHHMKLAGDLYTVVGVTSALLWQPVGKDGISGTMFLPAGCLATLKAPFPFRGATVIANARGSLNAAIDAIKRVIPATVPGVVVTSVKPYSQVIFASTAFQNLSATIVTMFAAVALLLAALGVYAVNSYISRARLPEFGLRAMLGATPWQLLCAALIDAAWILAVGLTGGAIGGFVLVRALGPQLFHVQATLPAIIGGSVGVIAVMALLAAARPASRAALMPVKTLLDAR